MSQTGLSPSTSSIPLAAENYQLKWNSHVTNLNSSISSLYKNDKYADVTLFTCNSDEGYCGIPAHKLILGTCSHYFASIFDNNPMPINGMLYIVLPAEISRRAVATLIQYMYTGEATVANDILNEVLKGGEILKIRGLCKVHSNEAFNSKPPLIDPPTYQPYKLMENGSATASPLKSNKSTPRNSIDKKSSLTHSETRSSSTISHHHHVLTQQESPVVVMTTQSNPPQSYAQQQSMNGNNQQQPTTIIVKKDMAIDPGDAIPVEHYGLISLKIAAAVKKAQQQCISSMKKSPSSVNLGPSSSDHREFYQIDESLRYEALASPPSFKVYTTSATNEQMQQQLQEDILRYTEKKKRMVENQKPSSSAGIRESSKSNRFLPSENGQQFAMEREKLPQFPEALSFLTIKEEPLEWTEIDGNGIDADNRTEIITVKPEALDESSMGSEVIDNKTYSPLTCEVCNLKFLQPAAWVRHIESHSELNAVQQNIPKKRRRADEVSKSRYDHKLFKFRFKQEENTENINILSCDLCENIHFATPGEWVRHVQSAHTETELALSNNTILMKKTNVKQSKESPSERSCSICKKTFPSYATMHLHRKTHNAEKSFVCPQSNCKKGFNVKSNLLRHMRSCHNQLSSNENQDSDSVD